MRKELIRLSVYTILFGVISTPIHLAIGSSIGVWLASSLIIGFFAGILNDIYAQLIELNKNN